MIRRAKKEDARELAEINYLVMNDFFQQKANTDEEKKVQIHFLTQCIESEDTVFTYRNVFIAERDGEIAGAIWIYDFSKEKERLQQLEDNILFSEQSNPLLQFIEGEADEARDGDIYLDTIAVAKNWQGKGVAGELLSYAKEIIENHGDKPLTLIVDVENPHAQNVYEKHDFEVVEETELYRSVFRYMRFK